MRRRLAAIMVADVVGYSHMSEIDEEKVRALFNTDFNVVFVPCIETNRGRLVKTLGDGLLVEFHSVIDAVRCAIQIQQQKSKEQVTSDSSAMKFRVGINLGDVLIEGDDIHGDGVIIADRVQSLAEPGGIAISGPAYDQVKSKLQVGFSFIGRRRLKGIAEPVRIYHVHPGHDATINIASKHRRWRFLLIVAVTGGLSGAAILNLMPIRSLMLSGWSIIHSDPLEQPSVAVLPFTNVSGDATHDHLAEGLTDDLITELSKVSGLFVIARHSVFSLRKAASSIQEIASELSVQYVVEGTLQREGPRLRINVKLIAADTGVTLWAEKYDRQYADLFAVQDDVTGKIISALSVTLSQGEEMQLARMPTDNLEAYDFFMRAEHEGVIYGDVSGYRRTLSFYQQAIDLDPDFANAYAGIARIAVDVWRNDYNYIWSAAVARKIAYDAAGQALKLDPGNARAHAVLAFLQWVDGRDAEALASANTAVAAQPNDAEAFGNLAIILAHTGDPLKAIQAIEKALRLDPSPAPGFKLLAGIVFYTARDNQRAIPLIEAAIAELPKTEAAHEYLAAAYLRAGEQVRAVNQAAELIKLFPECNLNYYRYLYDFWREDDLLRHLSALKGAGIPEWPFAFEGKEADRVKGDDLKALVNNRTWTGKHRNGTSFMQYFGGQGKTAYRSANTNITGVFEMDGDRLCETFDGYFLDRRVCGEIYRNSGRKPGDAPYVHVTPRSLQSFSVAEGGG